MDHDILIAELKKTNLLSTDERLALAQVRRQQQIEKFENFDSTSPITQKSRKSKFHVSCNYALLDAVKQQDIEEVVEFLKNGADPNFCGEEGVTALHMSENNIQLANILLEHGADINAQDDAKWTPLHAAAHLGHLDMTKFLVANGANLLAVNFLRDMPIDICEHEETLAFLKAEMAKRGITVDIIKEARKEPERQMLKDMKELVQRGESLDGGDQENGATYLHIAAANGYQTVVEYLLKNGAAADIKDMDEMTAVDIAKERGFKNIVTFIKDYTNGHFVA